MTLVSPTHDLVLRCRVSGLEGGLQNPRDPWKLLRRFRLATAPQHEVAGGIDREQAVGAQSDAVVSVGRRRARQNKRRGVKTPPFDIVRIQPIADPRKVRFQAVETEADDQVGWIAEGLLSAGEIEADDMECSK